MSINSTSTPSFHMSELYGPIEARKVSDRLGELDPELSSLIHDWAYGVIWARSGLTKMEKSLVTLSALITLGWPEQTRIHLKGFLTSGGTMQELRSLAQFLSPKLSVEHRGEILRAFYELGLSDAVPGPQSSELAPRSIALVALANLVAEGQQERIQLWVENNCDISVSDIRNIFIHLTVYCGFPAAMSAFAALTKARVNRKTR